MKDLQKLSNSFSEGLEFLDQHNQLLHSLVLSRQNAGNNPYTEETQGIRDGFIESGEGSDSGSGGEAA